MLDQKVKTFLTVCNFMNYTRAAEALNMTQPGVSQHIRALESYYGVKLFTYERRNLRLTPAGTQIRDTMLTIQHDTNLLRQHVLKSAPEQVTWRFGATKSIGEFLLPKPLGRCMTDQPQLRLDCHVENTQTLLGKLDDGTLDFALVEGNYAKQKYDSITLCRQRLIAVCNVETSISVSDISDLFEIPLIVRESGSGSREVLEHDLLEHGYDLGAFTSVSTVSSPGMIKQLLFYTPAVSFFYETVVQEELERGILRQIPIPGFEIVHEFNFIWQRGSLFEEEFKSICGQLFDPQML